MEFIAGVFIFTAICSSLFAILTTWTLWIGLGFLTLLVLEVVGSKYALRNDYSGDTGIPYLLCIMFPTLSLSVSFLLAALIKYIAVKSL